jgi:hypothetical protein
MVMFLELLNINIVHSVAGLKLPLGSSLISQLLLEEVLGMLSMTLLPLSMEELS